VNVARPRATALASATLLALLLVVAVGPAVAQQTEPWTILRYEVDLDVQADGSMQVTERIDLDFGALQRRGIFRYIPVWENLNTPVPEAFLDAIPSGRDPSDLMRVWRVDDVRVTSDTGAPTDLQIQGPDQANGNVFVRVGHPDRFITGMQQYTIRYHVQGALEPQADSIGLAWNAVGLGWPVPIQQAVARLQVPGVESAGCVQGPFRATTPCDVERTADGVTFRTSSPLRPFEGMTISAEFVTDQVTAPPIMVEDRPGLRRALIGSSFSLPLAVALLVLGVAGIITLAWRQGRDRVTGGDVTSHGTIAEGQPTERRRGLFEPRPIPVEFRPPDGLRPAQLGLIIDERVDAVDVTSTIVDLAVRGHLTIVEVPKSGWFRKADWSVARTDAPRDDLLGYELRLLDGLFTSRDNVLVSDLRGTFASDYKAVESAIYSDGQGRKWFNERPDHVRGRWVGLGIFLAALGVVGTIFLASRMQAGAVGLSVLVLGILLMALHRYMPHRTARGSALLVRTLGFRDFIETAEAGRMDFAEREQLFVQYLPYAVVFGIVDRWAKTFEEIGVDLGDAVGGFYVGTGPFRLAAFSAGMNDFSSSMATAVVQAPPSSSGGGGFSGGGGGFSGGGGGGGGGGSW
jgi:uncharacterized membrane protein YgcG